MLFVIRMVKQSQLVKKNDSEINEFSKKIGKLNENKNIPGDPNLTRSSESDEKFCKNQKDQKESSGSKTSCKLTKPSDRCLLEMISNLNFRESTIIKLLIVSIYTRWSKIIEIR